MKPLIPGLTLIVAVASARGDDFVQCPTPPPGPVGGPTETGIAYPFMVDETVRYQQVYNSSQFASVSPTNIYITTLQFEIQNYNPPPFNYTPTWTVTNMQINLSTTQRHADDLSPIFAENVGADDEVVSGPRSALFPGGSRYSGQFILLDRPFKYNPAAGNLLLDVRIFGGAHSSDGGPVAGAMLAFNSPTDTVSRVWASSVTALTADSADTIGLSTMIQFSPVPSLAISTYDNGSPPTNYVFLEWETNPKSFVLQRSTSLGSSAVWQDVASSLISSNVLSRYYYFPANSPGASNFYRLVWRGGY